ncbi:Nickel import ATP-binding protein NikO [bacterium HR13]|nr:Nickel import ATP-binding protein NikO [bacterium HR13]
MIELRGVYHSYDGEEVLRDINLTVKEGERVVLLGINGSGKTTLLKILNALILPQRGTYTYCGVRVDKSKLKDREFVRSFRKDVVMLFQNPDVMLFNPTVYDELAFSLRQLGFEEKQVEERVLYWADRFDLIEHLDKPPFKLSGGQKQKLCLACLLVLEPKILLLDEPTANLDPRTTGWLIDLLYDLNITTIVSTHNLSLVPELGDRLIVLGEDHGIVYDGKIETFLRDEEKMLKAGLLHKHRHKHGDREHAHYHFHL